VATDGECAIVDVQRWGEYFTIIKRVEIRSADDGHVLWSAQAKPSTRPQVHQLKLCLGANSRVPEMIGDVELFDFNVAAGGSEFEMIPNKEYIVEVSSPDYKRRARTKFKMRQ
jgi:hypothetical protein